MKIRKIQPADNKVIAAIIRQCFHDFNAPTAGTVYEDPTTDHLYELFSEDKSVLFVAEEAGQLLGCCGIFPSENLPADTVELVKFYLTASARGRGIGKNLMESAIDAAHSFGFKKVYIESLPEFSRAVSLYELQGFRKLSAPVGTSAHPGCNVWMLKDI